MILKRPWGLLFSFLFLFPTGLGGFSPSCYLVRDSGGQRRTAEQDQDQQQA
jgi:hypothetical protein